MLLICFFSKITTCLKKCERIIMQNGMNRIKGGDTYMTQYKGVYCVTDDLYKISNARFSKKIELGKGKNYGIWIGEEPYTVVSVEAAFWNPFNVAYIFGKVLYIGNGDMLIIVDLSTLAYRIIQFTLYFGYFFEYQSLLFVSSDSEVVCFQENGNVKWRTETLAVDGITFCECDNEKLVVSCCMNPCPALWCQKSLSLADGLCLDKGKYISKRDKTKDGEKKWH